MSDQGYTRTFPITIELQITLPNDGGFHIKLTGKDNPNCPLIEIYYY